MDAMAAGSAVVTSRIAGIPELVEDGVTGRLVPPGDLDALTAALAACLSDAEASAAMGHAAREKVARDFNVTTEAAKLSRLIEEGP